MQAHSLFLVASSPQAGDMVLRQCVVSYSPLTMVVVTQISVVGLAALASSENSVLVPLEWCLEVSRQQDGLKSSEVSPILKDSRFQSLTQTLRKVSPERAFSVIWVPLIRYEVVQGLQTRIFQKPPQLDLLRQTEVVE